MNRFLSLAIVEFLFIALAGGQVDQWRVASGTARYIPAALDIYRSNPDTLYAIGDSGTKRSTNRGERWDSIHGPRTDIGAIRVDPYDSKIIYASAFGRRLESNDVLMTTDGGTNWRDLFAGSIYPVAVIEIDPANYKTAYVGVGPSEIVRSTDRGNTWTFLNYPPAGVYLTSLAIDRSNDSVLYAGYVNGIFKSLDGGNTWQQLCLGFQIQGRTRIALNPINTQTIFVAIYSNSDTVPGGVYKSTDAGLRWSEQNTGLTSNLDKLIYSLSINPKDTNELFLSTGNRANSLARSTDAGAHWSYYTKGLPSSSVVTSVAIDTMHGRLYAGVSTFPTDSSGIYVLDRGPLFVDEQLRDQPAGFILRQNYPNPFNPTTMIEFYLPEQSVVTLKVYNTLCQEVASVFDKQVMDDGTQQVEFNALNLPSGVYSYRIVAQGIADKEKGTSGQQFIYVRKMLLLK
ncbi:MAG: T9SS type A sorting domain-containing protein [Ignavibacteria bacterium]|nr:T9SS type A sorting domain-containing protein [Ignavibacteria bacterium]MBI3765977.1 T9SS type A sorting domain-containing protein [Ignavibacteriales bacterium]